MGFNFPSPRSFMARGASCPIQSCLLRAPILRGRPYYATCSPGKHSLSDFPKRENPHGRSVHDTRIRQSDEPLERARTHPVSTRTYASAQIPICQRPRPAERTHQKRFVRTRQGAVGQGGRFVASSSISRTVLSLF